MKNKRYGTTAIQILAIGALSLAMVACDDDTNDSIRQKQLETQQFNQTNQVYNPAYAGQPGYYGGSPYWFLYNNGYQPYGSGFYRSSSGQIYSEHDAINESNSRALSARSSFSSRPLSSFHSSSFSRGGFGSFSGFHGGFGGGE